MKIPAKNRFNGKYAAQLKLTIAREYFTTDLGYSRLSKKYNIPSTTIYNFIKWYKEKYPDGTEQSSGEIRAADNSPAELKDAHLKITALEMLIENASKELGIDLVKKFGAKQSKK